MTITRVQHAINAGSSSVTLPSQPTEGNLLLAHTTHRTEAWQPSISGDGWTLIDSIAPFVSESSFRRGLAVFYKFAGADEPQSISQQWDGSGQNGICVQEFAVPAGITPVAATIEADLDSTSTTTREVPHTLPLGDALAVMLWTCREGETPTFDSFGDAISDGNGVSIAAAFVAEDSSNAPWSETVTWSNARHYTAMLVVFAEQSNVTAPDIEDNPYRDEQNKHSPNMVLWTIDGSTYEDDAGTHDGTITGAEAITDPEVLQALGFPPHVPAAIRTDGVDDLLAVPSHDDLAPHPTFAVEYWFAMRASLEGWAPHIAVGDDTWQVRRDASTDELRRIMARTGGSGGIFFGLDDVHHLAIVRHIVLSVDNGTASLYVDADLIGTEGADSVARADNSDLTIGAQDNDGSLRRFVSVLASTPTIYPSGLSAQDVQDLYDAAFADADPANLAATVDGDTVSLSWDASPLVTA